MDVNKIKDTFKKIRLGGSVVKEYNHLKKRRREIGHSVRVLDKIDMLDNPNAYKLNTKEHTEENNIKNKKTNEPIYETHLVNINNFELLMQSHDKLTEDNKFLAELFDKLKDRTITPKSQSSNIVPTQTLKQHNSNYNQTFSSEFWKTPRHKLQSTSATFGLGKIQELDVHKKKNYFIKDLNPLLFRIIKAASHQQEENESNQKEIKTYIKAYETNGFNYYNKQLNQTDRKGYGKIHLRKYKDNSKFSFSIINKIIFEKKKKVDVFEKAKERMIRLYEYENKKSKMEE